MTRKQRLASRLLYIGNTSLDNVRLVDTDDLEEDVRYTALSHCWGKSSALESLPKVYIKALSVARELDMIYLWIDSL